MNLSFIFMLCFLVVVTLSEAKPRGGGRMGRYRFPFSAESKESEENSREEAPCDQCTINNIGNGYKNHNEVHILYEKPFPR